MALALARSPKLRAFGWDVRRAEAQALQARLWPNPELEAEFENVAGSGPFSGAERLETTLSLAQTFPLGGDIARRRELADYQSQLAGWDYEAARLSVLTEVTQRYIALLAAHRRVAVAQKALQLTEQVQTTTRKRLDAGDASAIELTRAKVPVATAQVDLRRAQRTLAAARKRLALTWGSSEPAFEGVTGSLEQLRTPPAAERLVELINQNPELARWATEISARRAEARLAQAQAVPDLTGRLGIKRDGGEDAHAIEGGISLPLPLFDRRQGDVLAARLAAVSAEHRQRRAEQRLQAMLASAYARLANAYDEATTLRDQALPPATDAFKVTRGAFEKGDLAFIDVLDAERTLVDLRTRYIETLAAYHRSVAEIEGLISRPLDSVAPADDARTPQS
jgi:cobalt-zinc-cadmium efflux system outer membrane protein